MKKIIYICDKCGKELTGEIFQIGKTVELCEACADRFKNVLAGFLSSEKPKPETKKQGGARHRIQLDLGKIGGLYQSAGWSVKQIAEEMKCSEQTIRNHLDEAVAFYKKRMTKIKEENNE